MVSVLDFRSEGRWFEPSLCHRVVSLDKKLYCLSSSRCINAAVQRSVNFSEFTELHPWPFC